MAYLLYRASTTPATPGATSAKGSPLTNLEVDGNFKSLNDAIAAAAADAPSLTGTGASGTWGISITGNAGTVTNGVVTTGSYADPSWITSLAGSKVTGVVLEASTYANPTWITSLAGSKVTGAVLTSGLYADPSWITSLSYLKVGIPTVSGQNGKILSNNGTALQWITAPTGTGTADGNTTYTIAAATTTGGANISLIGADPSSTDNVKLASGTNVTVAYTDANTITVSSSYVDTNTTYTLGAAQSATNANIQLTAGGSGSGTQNLQLVAGANITLTATASTITIAAASGGTDTYYTYALSAVSQAGSVGAIIRNTSQQYINGAAQPQTTSDLLLTSGTGISMSGTSNTVTIAATVAATGVAGIVSTGSQVFTGAKTFQGAVTLDSTLSVTGATTLSAGLGVTGAITATGNITAYSSDARLKSNVQEITDAVAKIETIGGYTFDWNPAQCEAVGFVPEAEHEHGVIAQEIQAIMPDVVVPAAFNQDYLTVRYERIVPLLIQAVKELSARVKELEAR